MRLDVRKLNETEKKIYDEAKRALKNKRISAVEFSDKFFGREGMLRLLWSNRDDRVKLVQSPLFRWLQDHLTKLRKKEITKMAAQ